MKISNFLNCLFIIFLHCNQIDSINPSPKKSELISLSINNFDQLRELHSFENIWIVNFIHSSSSSPKNEEFEQLSKSLNGIIKVAIFEVDNFQHYFFKQNGIKTLPTIKFFGIDQNRVEYFGKSTYENLLDVAIIAIKRRILFNNNQIFDSDQEFVTEITDDNFEKLVLYSDNAWVLEFFSSDRDKMAVKNDLGNISENVGINDINYGYINIANNSITTAQLGIHNTTILYYTRGLKSLHSGHIYNNSLSKNQTTIKITDWISSLYNKIIPIPTIYQITDEKTARIACERTKLCVIAILPNLTNCEASCRHHYLDILHNVAEMYQKNSWGWLWFEFGTQKAIEQVLVPDIRNLVDPVLAVVSIPRRTLSMIQKPFRENTISLFLNSVITGTAEKDKIKIDYLPKINQVNLWDGKDIAINKKYKTEL